eukprot:scaffold16200_cov58-Cyclotella_meneghiniana.AAC.1
MFEWTCWNKCSCLPPAQAQENSTDTKAGLEKSKWIEIKVLAEYMERRQKKLWSEKDDRDDIEFWVKENPSQANLFVDAEGEDAADDDKDLDDEEIVMED